MREVIEMLEASPVGALATVEGGEPRVRPFQFMFAEGGALWFCTSTKKPVYGQLRENPKVEFLVSKGTAWARIAGEARFRDDPAAKARIIAANELVRSIYEDASNPVFAVFAIEHGLATMADFSGEPPRSYAF
jgi:uncharacterized pyridoxamine 5'-phosphate oxidase family protein